MSWSKIQRLGVVLYWDWSWIRWLFESFPWENTPNISWERVYSVFLGGSRYLFRREDFCMLKAKALHRKRGQEMVMWAQVVTGVHIHDEDTCNNSTYKRSLFFAIAHITPEKSYGIWKRLPLEKEKHGHKTTNFIQFLGCKAQLLVFFSSIEPNWGTSFAQLHCSQGAGEILGVCPLCRIKH